MGYLYFVPWYLLRFALYGIEKRRDFLCNFIKYQDGNIIYEITLSSSAHKSWLNENSENSAVSLFGWREADPLEWMFSKPRDWGGCYQGAPIFD